MEEDGKWLCRQIASDKDTGILFFYVEVPTLMFESPKPCLHNGLSDVAPEVSQWPSLLFTLYLAVYYNVLNYLSNPLEYRLMTEYNCESINFFIIEHLHTLLI